MLVIQFRGKKKEFPQLSRVPSGRTRQSALLARTPVIDSIKIPRLLDFLRILSSTPLPQETRIRTDLMETLEALSFSPLAHLIRLLVVCKGA
ncbi:hypothetical protein AVEN_19654-1 [Araneus ventricosus]|uniref:Uncharacterized protein n=1 Tax=Araneus ventricosus TaxID=182803 RepID=A0A4Y2C3A9_ARAVE|nr:hypothetical protein AVEN_19654-1 [Araneus ventricosus]